MGRLSSEQTWELIGQPIISFITTIHGDGTPHVTPVWHLVDSDEVVVAVARDTVKARNVRANPQVALCVAANERPQPWVLINGAARLSEERVEEIVRTVSFHYLGEEEGGPYVEDILQKLDFVILRIAPEQVIAFDGLF
jgi:PPOX class probable F420-dependent enzyme